MRRCLAGLMLLLESGCAGKATPVSPPPAPAAVPAPAQAKAPWVIEGRVVPPEVFLDPERREKIAATLPKVRATVARFVEADRLIGVAVGVVVDGELVLGEGFGVRHSVDGGAVDARTVFRIGSITKTFTAMTALQLAEAGQLDLDAPATDVLPELGGIVYPGPDTRRFTTRDILTHTAGLPRNPDVPPRAVDRGPSRDELMRAIHGMSLVRPPGVAYEYSNLGFALLGHIIAGVRGESYRDAVRGVLLTPLGMRDTVWALDDVAAGRLALGHSVKDGGVVPEPPTRHGDIDAAGGLFSTVEDLARFVAFQLAAWPPRVADDRAPLRRATLRDAQALRGGLVWRVSQGCDQVHVVGHGGAVDGYHATVRMLTNAGIGIIVLANAGWADTNHISEEVQRALADGGHLELRAPQAFPALTTTAIGVTRMLAQWDDAAFRDQAALAWQDEDAIPRLGERVRWLHAALGACTLGPLKRSTSAWSGTFTLACERGAAELGLALTTARTPKIAALELSWTDGTPTVEVQTAAAAGVALLDKFDAPAFAARFSPTVRRTTFEQLATRIRGERGVCQMGRALAVAGPETAAFALSCDRGEAKLTLALERGPAARIAAFNVVTAPKPPCR